MKKKVILVLISVCVIALTLVVMTLANPLLKSENRIRGDILKLTPIGTSMDDVLTMIGENDNWRTVGGSSEHGYSPTGQQCIGERYKSVNIGRREPFIEVRSIWIFDKNGILIDICIERILTP
ncbi:MAG: hypothetical protein FWG42_02910 [Clostridiales bacterium]|nr:hypothetical protein [Clostridiales bacterium]